MNLRSRFSENYCLVAALGQWTLGRGVFMLSRYMLALCAFDWSIRVGQEIDFMWRRRCSVVTLLYTALQVTTLASLGLQCYDNLVDVDCDVCLSGSDSATHI